MVITKFKEYAKWLFPYTDKLEFWDDYEIEYDKTLTAEEIDLRYKLQSFMWFCLKHNFSCNTNGLYENISSMFLTGVIVVKYADKKYLLAEYNGQGTMNTIEVIIDNKYDKFGYLDLNELFAKEGK